MRVKVDLTELIEAFIVMDERSEWEIEMSDAEIQRLRDAEKEYYALQDILRARLKEGMESGDARGDTFAPGDATVITGI